jgi:hypothetical protein
MAFDPSMLSHFTGTEHYYRLNRQCVITDGAKYLADDGLFVNAFSYQGLEFLLCSRCCGT